MAPSGSRAAVLAAVVLLAGCSGPFGLGGDTPTETPAPEQTATPTPTPTESPDPTETTTPTATPTETPETNETATPTATESQSSGGSGGDPGRVSGGGRSGSGGGDPPTPTETANATIEDGPGHDGVVGE